MTQVEQIIDYLWSIAPAGATNSQLAQALGIRSHQGIYMTTQNLMGGGRIRGEQQGKTWVFYAMERLDVQLTPATPPPVKYRLTTDGLTPAAFEEFARQVMQRHYGVAPLRPGQVASVPKRFDFVSADQQVVGDAKYYTRVGGVAPPPAKFSIIAEYVWLLEKTGASHQFLVFGHDRYVPQLWLARYGRLVSKIAFYFLAGSGELEPLNEQARQGPN